MQEFSSTMTNPHTQDFIQSDSLECLMLASHKTQQHDLCATSDGLTGQLSYENGPKKTIADWSCYTHIFIQSDTLSNLDV